ncbi:MAG: archease [Candidatus Hatepunaea meridiana]|nr:archease [Candidatus Hatepunaea meridiana]
MFHFVEHKADLAVELEAKDKAELFKTALEALIELIIEKPEDFENTTDLSENLRISSHTISIAASGFDDEERLISLMNEFLYLCQVKGFRPLYINNIKFDDKGNVMADLSGFSVDSDIKLIREIKAATYHDVKIESGEVWRVKVVLDV